MRLIDDLLGFVVPRTCLVCGNTLVRGEEHFCMSCNCEMPRTNLHLAAHTRVSERLARLQPSTPLAAWFYYRRETSWAHVIHLVKYAGRPGLAREMGRLFARELLPSGFFDDVDCLVPVPMHFVKRIMRGYNQARQIALGVADVTGLPLDSSFYARHSHAVQARRSANERTQNVFPDMFDVRSGSTLAGKRVLAVDDVVTTGATIEAVVSALLSKGGVVQAKILCLGLTEND